MYHAAPDCKGYTHGGLVNNCFWLWPPFSTFHSTNLMQKYLEAGAHIISTNTFNSNRVSQEDYDLQHLVDELNHAGARIARECIQQLESVDPTPRFVAGSMGPSNKSISRGNTSMLSGYTLPYGFYRYNDWTCRS